MINYKWHIIGRTFKQKFNIAHDFYIFSIDGKFRIACRYIASNGISHIINILDIVKWQYLYTHLINIEYFCHIHISRTVWEAITCNVVKNARLVSLVIKLYQTQVIGLRWKILKSPSGTNVFYHHFVICNREKSHTILAITNAKNSNYPIWLLWLGCAVYHKVQFFFVL